jgi:hypothetical protein
VIENPTKHEWWLEEGSEWVIKKWAGKLKQVASLLTGIPKHKFEDQEFKKTLLGPEWGTVTLTPLNSIPVFADIEFNSLMSVRDFLQKLGTDGLRDGLHENVWVNALMADYKPIDYNDDVQPEPPNWIITDMRFPNEFDAVKKRGGITIYVHRPDTHSLQSMIGVHESETALDNHQFDYAIINHGSIEDLVKVVRDILINERII